jgi:hypothetical protein
MHTGSHARKIHLLIFALAILSPFAPAQTTASPAEQALFHMANQVRAQHGIPPLQWNASLASAARAHANRLLQESGELQHQYSGEQDLTTRAAQTGTRFSTIAENIARRAQTPAQLQQVWMSSAPHRANLLNPDLNIVGIAVFQYQGLLYAVEDFARDVPIQRHDDIARRISQLLRQRGIAPAPSNRDAQQTCGMASGAAGTPRLVIQWDGPNPTQLPDVLLQQIATGRFTSAAVGACPGQHPEQHFTTYHVAVLLY